MPTGIFVVMAGRQAGGPESYEHELVRNLALLDSENEFHIYCLSDAAARSFALERPNFRFHVLWPSFRPVSMAVSLPLALRRDGIGLLHATFTPPPLPGCPLVFTNHCASNFVHPEFYDPIILLRLNRLILAGLRRARVIVCVSQNVCDLTAEHYGIEPERLAVVYNGVGEHFCPLDRAAAADIVRERYGLDRPYLLYVGKLERRKNIRRLLEAYAGLRRAIPDVGQLVLAGRPTPAAEDYPAIIRDLKLGDAVVQVGHLDNADLPALYSAAELFLFPSLWEGFGIPVLEAMACGTPVITSNLSSLPEVAGDAALLVDPYRTGDLTQAMARLWEDEALRGELRRRGLARAQAFSWKKTAADMREVYRRAAAL